METITENHNWTQYKYQQKKEKASSITSIYFTVIKSRAQGMLGKNLKETMNQNTRMSAVEQTLLDVCITRQEQWQYQWTF